MVERARDTDFPERGLAVEEPVSTGPQAESDAQLRFALEAGTRAGSNLGALSHVVAELSSGLSGAKQANERLDQELETLRDLLVSIREQKLALAQRVTELESALAEASDKAERELRYVTEQQDAFLTALLEENDDAERLARSESEREQAEAARFALESELTRAHEALFVAQQARDDARALADERERERDELRAEASRLRAGLGVQRPSTAPPPLGSSHVKRPSFTPSASLALDEGELDSNLHPRAPTPLLPRVEPRPRATDRPPSLRPSSSPEASATPFPREATRPGVGGPPPSPSAPPPRFGPPAFWTPPPPAAEPTPSVPNVRSAAYLPQVSTAPSPILKQKPAPATRPLVDYSVGEGGVQSELLEGARLSSPPPRK